MTGGETSGGVYTIVVRSSRSRLIDRNLGMSFGAAGDREAEPGPLVRDLINWCLFFLLLQRVRHEEDDDEEEEKSRMRIIRLLISGY